MKLSTIRHITSRLFITTAYFTVILQWLWLAVIVLPPLIESGALDYFANPVVSTPIVQPDPVKITGPALWLIAGVTIFILILTIFVLIKIPKTVLHSGDVIVHRATEVVVPVVTNHKVINEKNRRTISRRVTLAVQLVSSVIPAVVCLFLPAVDGLPKEVITAMALAMAVISLTCFVLAWLLEPSLPTSRTRSHASRG